MPNSRYALLALMLLGALQSPTSALAWKAGGFGDPAQTPNHSVGSDWQAEGYWVDGNHGSSYSAPGVYNDPYRPNADSYRSGYANTGWGADSGGYRDDPGSGYQVYPPALAPYDAGYGASPSSGFGESGYYSNEFRPNPKIPGPHNQTWMPSTYGGESTDSYYSAGTDYPRFRNPVAKAPGSARQSPVWFRDKASGRQFRFRPVTEQEQVSRPSDHSFNSLRYARPAGQSNQYPASGVLAQDPYAYPGFSGNHGLSTDESGWLYGGN